MDGPGRREWRAGAGCLGRRADHSRWEELGKDLSNAASPGALSALLRVAYPDDGPRTIDNWAYQLWQFLQVMEIGDLVVMPQKHKSVIAIGRVTGDIVT